MKASHWVLYPVVTKLAPPLGASPILINLRPAIATNMVTVNVIQSSNVHYLF